MTMLTTIHVSLSINGIARKRPLRVYDASAGKFGVIVKGECVPVTATSKNSVTLDPKGRGKPEGACRAAKLADLGIAKADRAPIERKAATITGKLTPELATQMIAMLQDYLAS